MNKEQFFTKNHLTMNERNKVFFVATLEMRLRKYLISQNESGVRDYVIIIRIFWPKLKEIPISLKLFKSALVFLKSRGWHLHLNKDHSKRINGYVTRTR